MEGEEDGGENGEKVKESLIHYPTLCHRSHADLSDDEADSVAEDEDGLLQAHGDAVARSFKGSRKWRGGVASTDTTLKGLYRSLCKEVLAEGTYNHNQDSQPAISWHQHKKGLR